ncbi:MAG: DMT family transporter [Deltaproteobacteria bacterium]|nr:DMT family transporter [Deltaproteobacteria bacterium]
MSPTPDRAARGAVLEALAAAALFGAAAPLGKLLVYRLAPLQLAGLLYLGAALAVLPVAWRRGGPMDGANRRRLAAAVLCGGIVAPVLLVLALRIADAAAVSLLLTLEVAATAALGALFFRDVLGRRGWVGIAGVLLASATLAWSGGAPGLLTAALVGLACLLWGLDNNLTALIDALPPARVTLIKGAVAGGCNLLLAALLMPEWPGLTDVAAALAIGALCYGLSLVLFIRAAQRLGAVRAQATFATAPFWGVALAAAVLGEALPIGAVGAMLLAGLSVFILVRARHTHWHRHEPLEHEHSHRHDDGHHAHEHDGLPADTRHTHRHAHGAIAHAHPHLPDLHHRHAHEDR